MARPTKLTPELTVRVEALISEGNYIETAAAFVGIAKKTLYNWLRRGARERDRLEKVVAETLGRHEDGTLPITADEIYGLVEDPESMTVPELSEVVEDLGLDVEATGKSGALKGDYIRAIEALGDAVEPSRKEAPYVEFLHAVTRASARSEARLVRTLDQFSTGHVERDPKTGDVLYVVEPDWRAAMAVAERRFRERWSRTVNVTSDDPRAELAEILGLDPDDLPE